jgi:thiosulfate/3-mercaptopyruvate sulfurtransferase
LQVVDARPKGMFDGTAPDPNPKLHSGHILGSINFPFTNVLDVQNKKLKDIKDLKQCKEILLYSYYCTII